MTSKRRAVFLDRDGVINEDPPVFVTCPEQFHMLPGSPGAIRKLAEAGFARVVITNQSGITRGLFTVEDLAGVHGKMARELAEAGTSVDAIYFCPHPGDFGCACRKPSPGNVLLAREEHDLDPTGSYFVGDKPLDIECGSRAGCYTILVLSGITSVYEPGRFAVQPDMVCANLAAAAEWIVARDPAAP